MHIAGDPQIRVANFEDFLQGCLVGEGSVLCGSFGGVPTVAHNRLSGMFTASFWASLTCFQEMVVKASTSECPQ